MKSVFPSLLAKTLLSASLMGAGFAALAQTTPPPVPAAGDQSAMRHMGHGRMDPAKMEARRAKHLADLKTRLKITPAQEGAWTTFTGAMKPPARTMERPDRAALDKLSTPERIDTMRVLRAKHHAERQVAMDQRDQAVKTFYAALNDEQKKVMDTEHARMGKRMERMHGGRHHGDDKKSPKPTGS
ncbi:MAG: Spy/CpxP family protein refolding chaperone [Rhodoferax sp.]|nr:Spy/CpxP family protein refolding chaperone [Rhodoferax sp.]